MATYCSLLAWRSAWQELDTTERPTLSRFFHQFLLPCFVVGSVTRSCPTLCEPTDRSMLVFPVLHNPADFAQTQVRGIGDAIQPSHPLLPSSPSASNLSQNQGLFQ